MRRGGRTGSEGWDGREGGWSEMGSDGREGTWCEGREVLTRAMTKMK